nr:putative mediator of RNA polymerase II transcription subunit 12 [Cherax quadricarinatus]
MDLTLSVFFIEDIADSDNSNYNSALAWIMCLYFRLFFFWILNLEEFATGCNAFCKSYHKRTKQARLKAKQEKKMAVEVEKAAAAADEAARAEMREWQEAERQRQEQEAEHQRQQQQEERQRQQQQEERQRQQQQFEALGVDNDAYEETTLASQTKERPPVAKKPSVPPELRPFNYLNPFFRPTDQHDIEGMKANPAFEEPLMNLKRNSSHISNQEDYFPFDGYIKLTDTVPVAPDPLTRRHGSMRNLNSQPPQHHVKRSFSTKGPHDDYPRNNSSSKYTGAWDTNTGPSNNLVGLPRIHLAESKAVLRPPRDADFLTHQEQHLLPPHQPSSSHPSSQPRPYVPPHDQEAHYSPMDRDRHYFPPPSQERDYFQMESQEREYSPQRANMAPPPAASRKHHPQDISQTTYYI